MPHRAAKKQVERRKSGRRIADGTDYQQALETALDNLPLGVALLRMDGRPVFFNEHFCKMYDIDTDIFDWQMTFDEMIDKGHMEDWKQDPREYFEDLYKTLAKNNDFKAEIEIGDRIIAIHNVRLKDDLMLSTQADVTERVRAERRVAHMARHDPLTDLPNRVAFIEKFVTAIEEARAKHQKLAVLSIDLDRFKDVNDIFGHSTGDMLLQTVANRFRDFAGNSFPARLGGDEFCLISTANNQPEAGAALAAKLFENAAGEIETERGTLMVGLSIGMAIFPDDGDNVTTLLANADAALYRAKEEGRGVMRSFSPEADARIREQRTLQSDLRQALKRGEFTLHYQPQSDVENGITGFEALLRWQHPGRGMLLPGSFISLAEENGIIVEIGKWVLREACLEAKTWKKPLAVAVNLSPVQFRYGDLAQTIHEVLLETGLAPNRLEVEITEGVLVSDFARALAQLRRIKNLGVHIAMDDFGIGYSSLSYLQAFPFDTLKIDRSFTNKLGKDTHTDEIVRAVIGLGRGLKLPVVAEGVETSEQLEFLAREQCKAVQGYLVGRPAPIADYADIVGAVNKAPKSKRAVHG